MSGVLYGSLLTATQLQRRVQSSLVKELDYILASEVVSAFRDRCANGMQYTTFPNRITELEKGKLESAGYIVTENTIISPYRNGAPDLYIGFQVALNATAAEKAMAISPSLNPVQPVALYDADGKRVLDADGNPLYALGG